METTGIPQEQWPIIERMCDISDKIESGEVECVKKYLFKSKEKMPETMTEKLNEGCILSYAPSGHSPIMITLKDYKLLETGEWLNSTIVRFYTTYIYEELLTPSQRNQTHMFDINFYELLMSRKTTAGTENLTLPEKRYQRVRHLTKNVNIFEKDFLIVPILRFLHWYMAIICFPGLQHSDTSEEKGNKSGINFDLLYGGESLPTPGLIKRYE